MRQIDLLNPNVFIFANTLHLYRTVLNLSNETLTKRSRVSDILKEGKLFIDAYHPAQTIVKRGNYVNDIVELVEKWSNGELIQ